jgi:L-asparaginase
MKLALLTTGGTIDKTYNEHRGILDNFDSVLARILAGLRLPDLEIRHVEVMNKDSLFMDDGDRKMILEAVVSEQYGSDAILITHGTDTLEKTGDFLHYHLNELHIPIVLTGAMRPYEFRDTDAVQNVTEALLAVRLMPPGVYVSMHNRVIAFPGVVKNREHLVFEKVVTPES